MKPRFIVAAALAFALVLGMTVAPAGAYFTDHSTANGGLILKVTPTTEIQEWYANRTKQVVISNAANATTDVYVRARVYSAVDYEAAGDGWTADGDWFVYGTALKPGDAANEFDVTLNFPAVKSEEQPDGAVIGDNYNVVVVYESTPVQYRADGTPYADWDYILDSGN